MAKYKIVVTDDRFGSYREEKAVLDEIGAELVVGNTATEEELISLVRDADGVLVNLALLTACVIREMSQCRIIVRYGVGYDNVDVCAATAKGIAVAHVPDFCSEDVSDHTLALMLSCMRRIVQAAQGVRAGKWNLTQKHEVHRMKGKVFGLIGYGKVARCVHRKLKGFEPAEVLACDPHVDSQVMESEGARKVDLEVLCRKSDLISLHIPLNASTRGMMGEHQFSLMKPTAIVINVSRGSVVDEKALIKALHEKRIMAAGLDVFEQEPPEKDNPLLQMDQVIVSDHAGWYTQESLAELKTEAARNIVAALTLGQPIHPVNQIG